MSILFSLVIVLFSAIIHEYMHGWAADQLGDPTARYAGRLTINPLAHIDPWGSVMMPALLYIATGGGLMFGYAKPVPVNHYNLRGKYGEALVAISGPLANFITALFFGLILRFLPIHSEFLAALIGAVVQINLVLMVFNLVPIPPLDGSKVIMPFLPSNIQESYASLERYGFFLVLLFIMFGFSFITPIIIFLFKMIVGLN